uniref:AlkB homolog 7 n=1 Tax=Sinocyclocheilus grahami TaxID=75366 RepID=A0A672N5S2_SINGR
CRCRLWLCKWLFGSFQEILAIVHGHVEVRHNFSSEEAENVLFKKVETGLRKKLYEFDHWDDVKTEKCVLAILAPAVGNSPLLGPVHVLDLDKDGYIKPHTDSVKFCGSTIAKVPLSLLSDIVMRLVPENKSTDWVDLLLSRRSLYILRVFCKCIFKCTHETLKDEKPFFSGQKVPCHRRISDLSKPACLN